MADKTNLSKSRINGYTLAQKKAHRKLYSIFVVMCCLAFSVRADITNDVQSIKNDISTLRNSLCQAGVSYYQWSTGANKTTLGMAQSIMLTLRNFAQGVHDDILPKIKDIADNTSNLSNLTAIADILQRVEDTQASLSSDVNSIMWAVLSLQYSMDYLTTYVYDIYQDLGDTKLYVYDMLQELQTLRLDFQNYKDLALDYLQSIDNNVSSIAENVQKGEGYLSDIYNSISAGINVSLLNGFPEPIDYTALLEHMSNCTIWGHYNEWYSDVYKKYLTGGMRYRNYDDWSTNTIYQESVSLSGDFFTDTVSILSNSDQTLADISKSLMLLVRNSQSNNVADVDVDREAQDGTPTDSMDSPTDITTGLSFPTSSGHLTLPDVSSLDNKQFPTFIDYEIPHMMGLGGGMVSINTGKCASAFTAMRNICLFFYWGLTAMLFVYLYKLFSKYVLGSLMKLAFAFVQKGKAV